MPQHFDISGKKLIGQDPKAYCQLVGYKDQECILLDTGSTLSQLTADSVILLPALKLAVHLEMQSTYDPLIGERILQYNVPLHMRLWIDVDSVLVLLRKEADGPNITGKVTWANLEFNYRVFRLWEMSEDDIMNMPLAVLPFAPLCNVKDERVGEVLHKMNERLIADALSEKESTEFWATTQILLGLRFSAEEAAAKVMEVFTVEIFKDSSVYQQIVHIGELKGIDTGMQLGEKRGILIGEEKGIQIGRQDGELEEARNLLLLMGQSKFGNPSESLLSMLNSINSKNTLEKLAVKLLGVDNWEELFAE